MGPDVVPGAVFPDYELPDHTETPRRLSDLQGNDPLILTLARGQYCPKEHQQHRLFEARESVPHQLVRLCIHLSGHPAEPHALEVGNTSGRGFVQLVEMRLSHRGAAVHLVDDELGVRVGANLPDPVATCERQTCDQRPVLRHVLSGGADPLGDLGHGDEAARPKEDADSRVGQGLPGSTSQGPTVRVEQEVPGLRPGGAPRPRHLAGSRRRPPCEVGERGQGRRTPLNGRSAAREGRAAVAGAGCSETARPGVS